MQAIKIIVVMAVVAIAILVGWRVGSEVLANIQLQEDMHDLASQSGNYNYIRYNPPASDDDFRDAVIRKAKKYDIELEPRQVTVQRTYSGNPNMYLAADYTVPVNLPGYSFSLHFTPSSTKRTF